MKHPEGFLEKPCLAAQTFGTVHDISKPKGAIMKTETFSYLPALSEEQVTKQIQYFLKNGWTVGIEYCAQPSPELAFWNWWKLPLFTARTTEEIVSTDSITSKTRLMSGSWFRRMLNL